MSIADALLERGATIVSKESVDGMTQYRVRETCLNELYEVRKEFDIVRCVGVRGDVFSVDVCDFDHSTRDNSTFYGGGQGHDYHHCDGCGERLSFIAGEYTTATQ